VEIGILTELHWPLNDLHKQNMKRLDAGSH